MNRSYPMPTHIIREIECTYSLVVHFDLKESNHATSLQGNPLKIKKGIPGQIIPYISDRNTKENIIS